MALKTGRRKRKLKAEINVVPYIDVMLVLLIIFMVTAPLLNLGVDINLPESNAKSIQEKTDPVIVTVDAEGNYFLAVEAGSHEAVTEETLTAKVRGIVSQNPDAAVFVAGDATTSYQEIMRALVVLQSADVQRVGLMSQPTQTDAE